MHLVRNILILILSLTLLSTVHAQIAITEFMANNVESILDEDGNHEDWIEIKNTSAGVVDLSGWYLTDSSTQLRKWAFPSKTLNPGQYLVVFASNKDRRNPLKNLHTNFKLDAGGEYLALTKAETNGGTTVVQFWNPYPPQGADGSYGITEAGTVSPVVTSASASRRLIPNATTGPAAAALWRGGNEPYNDATWTAGTAALGHAAVPTVPLIGVANCQYRINATDGQVGIDSSGLNRIVNNFGVTSIGSVTDTTPSPLKRNGVLNFVGSENDQLAISINTTQLNTAFNVPASTVCFWMKANPPTGAGSSGAMLWDRRAGTGVGVGIVIVQQDDGKITLQSQGGFCSMVSTVNVSDNQWHHVAVTLNTNAGETVTLYVDGQPAGSTVNTGTWGWATNQAVEIGRSHDPYWRRYTGILDDARFYNRNLTPAEIADIAAGADTLMGTQFASTTGVDQADYNIVNSQLNGITGAGTNPSAYVRIPFTIADLNAIGSVKLSIQQADGFIAWVNGVQVLSANAPASPSWNSTAASSIPQDPGRFRVVTIPKTGGPLVTGSNILAIQLMNNAVGAPNVLLRPTIDAVSATSGNSVYFAAETPGASNSAPLTAVGPHVAQTTKNPTPPVGGAGSAPLVITSKVSATLNAVGTVQVAYRTMWSAETLVTMLDNGVAPDALAGDKIFTASIPTTGLSPGQMIRWRIIAKDSANNTTTDPLFIDLDGIAGQDTDQYYGTIAPDSGYTTLLPVLHWFIENPANADTLTGTRASVFYLGRFYDYVYVNIHGQSTQGFPKKSYNLNFNKDNRFKWKEGEQEIRSVNFLSNYADKSKLRNTLAWSAWADSKHAASHFSEQLHVRRATSSETMQFFSIADMVEDGNEEYLDRCGLDEDGALYKMYNSLEGSAAPGAEKKTREFEDNSDLAALVAGINAGRTLTERRQYLYDNVNVPALINFCVVHSLIANTDWGHKNYYIYRDTMGTKEWFALPWDQDLSFGHSWWGAQNYFDDEIHSQGTFPSGGGGNHLMQLVYNVPELNAMFLRRSRTLMDQIFISASATNGVWDNRVTSLIDRIDPPAGPPPAEVTIFDGTATPCKWLIPSASNGGFSLTAGAGANQWTNYTAPPNIANWTDASTGIGYATDNDPNYLNLVGAGGNVGAMFNINATCYVRVEFTIPDAAALANIGTLLLGMKYEDGFRAYINGTAVVGRNDTDASMTNDPSTAISNVTRDEAAAVAFESMDISATGIPALRVGTNVLAVHILNAGAGSSDLLMVPKLSYFPPNAGPTFLTDADRELQKWGWWVDGNATQQFGGVLDAATHTHGARLQAMRILNSNPNPPQTSQASGHETGDSTFPFLVGRRQYLFNNSVALGIPASQSANPTLVIEDIDFNPASANQDDEYFVIRNNSGAAVDLSDWKLTGAVEYTFPAGTVIPAYTTGAENIGRLHVSRSPAAFRVRTSGASGGQYRLVVGPYSGSLSARGETIELRRPDNTLLISQVWTAAPTAAQNQLRVSEINYAPAAPTVAEATAIPGVSASDFEYIELVNTGGSTLSLAGARFTRGIEFTFPLGASLAPGARTVLVSNQAAFIQRYGAGATIGGQYIGNLSNSGDTLRIVDSQGEEVLEFKYEPSWFPQSDGGGYSLVVRNASPNWTDYGTPSAPLPNVWALSATTGGTPGLGDTDNANGFEGWRFNHWTLGEVETIGAPVTITADADGDGMTNFAEYAYGRNPRVQDSSALSTAGKVNVSGTDYPSITFTRRHLAIDVTWSVQESTDLAGWNATTVLVSTTQLGNGLEQVTYRSATTANSTPRYFRVVATK